MNTIVTKSGYYYAVPASKQKNIVCQLLKKAMVAAAFVSATFTFSLNIDAQQAGLPVIVRPGAPGQPSQVLPPDTRAQLPAFSVKDVEFMQGMIMHHAQAVEMTDMIAERTANKDIHMLGGRISKSQSDEMAFMERWLKIRGQSTEMKMTSSSGGHDHGHGTAKHEMTMPGMLTKEQMTKLRNSKGNEFDRLFLSGMIQHHEGALVMVKDLFATAGAGQDAELFNFASDVDSGQRAEINTMQSLLSKFPSKDHDKKSHEH